MEPKNSEELAASSRFQIPCTMKCPPFGWFGSFIRTQINYHMGLHEGVSKSFRTES